MHAPIKVAVADNHEIFRKGFRLILKYQQELRLVGEAGTGKDLIELVHQEHPDVVITDIRMPEMDGIEACSRLKMRYPGLGIIALTMLNDEQSILRMLEAGATGYLLKNTTRKEVIDAIKAVQRGETYYCPSTSKLMTGILTGTTVHACKKVSKCSLTAKEIEIMQLICEQYSNKQIADKLDLSIRTVESYREKIFEKTDSRNMVGVAIYAIRNKLYAI